MSRKWINFFADAGIPSSAAATYALIFSENRISENMLLDLDREVLKEMGIQTMGDVISILKHARLVYEKTARDTVLQSSSKDKPENAAKKTLISTVSIPENDPYFYSPSVELKKPAEEKKAPRKEGPVLPPNMKLSSKVASTSNNHRETDIGVREKRNKDCTILKRKIKTSVQKGVIVKEETEESDSSSNSSTSSSLECVSKCRKVMPEPSSTNTSSSGRSATAKPFCFSGTKRTVSILDKEPEIIPKAGTTFTITMGGARATSPEPTKKSVFSRLDNKRSIASVHEVDSVMTDVEEKKFPFDDNGLQPTVEIINDLYTPPVETYVKDDARAVHEPVAWVKPIIHTEGILANPAVKPKVGPRGRLGITSTTSSYRSQPHSNSFEQKYTVVNSTYTPPTDGPSNSEMLLDDDVFYTNGLQSNSTHLAKAIEKKVSLPSMDYEMMEKPSVKNRISLSQPTFHERIAKGTVLKPPLTPKERITMGLVSSSGTKIGGISVKNRIRLNPSVRESASLKPIRERITFNSATSVRERVGAKPTSIIRDRISSKTPLQIKDRISLKPSARERISVKPTPSVRGRIGFNTTPSVKERISLKSAPSARERINLKAAPSIRERISLKSVTPARGRINGTPASSSREVISLKSPPARERIISKLASSVKNRISLNAAPTVRERISVNTRPVSSGSKLIGLNRVAVAHKGVPPRARYGDLSNGKTALKNISVSRQSSKTPSVFNRLG